MFRIQLFGKFIAFDEHGVEVRFEAQSSARILVLLYLRKGRAISRQELGEIIWPDSTQDQQRTNLRKAISRLPKVFEASGAIAIGPEYLTLNTSMFHSELEEGEVAHRKYLQDRDSDIAPGLLEEFWQIIRNPMLAGWDQPWFEALRTRYSLWSDEVGAELAEQFEGRGSWEDASRIWRSVLEDNPLRLEAIQGLLRSESALHGGEHAQAVVHQVLPSLSDSMVSSEVQQIFRAHEHQSAMVPTGEFLRKRGPILLLVNLFERNLQRGGNESLQLLAAEMDSEFALQYPKVFLSLLDTALTHSSGWHEVRKTLLSGALRFASRSCEFEVGHFWADEAIERGPDDELFAALTMTLKAFMYFEERQYAKAEAWFRRAGNLPVMSQPHSTRSFYRVALSGLLWQQTRFEEAIEICEEERAYGESLRSLEGSFMASRALSNLSYIAGAQHHWDKCAEYGEKAVELVGSQSLHSMVLMAPIGSAKIMTGRVDEGLADVKAGLDATAGSGMKRYHQVAFDYVTSSVAKLRGQEIAQQLADANAEHRRALRHFRSPAEIELLNRSGLVDRGVMLGSELTRQSPKSLNKFLLSALLH